MNTDSEGHYLTRLEKDNKRLRLENRKLRTAIRRFTFSVGCMNKSGGFVEVKDERYKGGVGISVPTNVFSLLIKAFEKAEKLLAKKV